MYAVKEGEFEQWYAGLLDKLRNEQEMQGLSNTALASLAGVSCSCARGALNWIKCPTIETLFRIMAALEVDFDRITTDYNNRAGKSDAHS